MNWFNSFKWKDLPSSLDADWGRQYIAGDTMEVRVIQYESHTYVLNALEQAANKIIAFVMFPNVDQILS